MTQVVGVSVVGADVLEGYHVWQAPYVKAHLVRITTGEYLYVNSANEDISCSGSTHVCEGENIGKEGPRWHETLRLYADYAACVQPPEHVAILFEIYEKRKDQDSWVSSKDDLVAWAFLRLVSQHGKPHVDKPLRLQLYRPPHIGRYDTTGGGAAGGGGGGSRRGAPLVDIALPRLNQPIAGEWLINPRRDHVRGSLRVTVHPVAPLPPQSSASGWCHC